MAMMPQQDRMTHKLDIEIDAADAMQMLVEMLETYNSPIELADALCNVKDHDQQVRMFATLTVAVSLLKSATGGFTSALLYAMKKENISISSLALEIGKEFQKVPTDMGGDEEYVERQMIAAEEVVKNDWQAIRQGNKPNVAKNKAPADGQDVLFDKIVEMEKRVRNLNAIPYPPNNNSPDWSQP